MTEYDEMDFCGELCLFAEELIQKAREPKWIPVSERLPDTFGEYIVAIKAFDGSLYSDYADYDPFPKRWKTGLYMCPNEIVTHWMPLPEPPKEV